MKKSVITSTLIILLALLSACSSQPSEGTGVAIKNGYRYQGELANGYKIRRAAIDFNIPLVTNARLASTFIKAFCNIKVDDIQIKSWDEYK